MVDTYHDTMTKLVAVNEEISHDDKTYKRNMYNKEKTIQQTALKKYEEKNSYSDKVYNDTILNNSSNN